MVDLYTVGVMMAVILLIRPHGLFGEEGMMS